MTKTMDGASVTRRTLLAGSDAASTFSLRHTGGFGKPWEMKKMIGEIVMGATVEEAGRAVGISRVGAQMRLSRLRDILAERGLVTSATNPMVCIGLLYQLVFTENGAAPFPGLNPPPHSEDYEAKKLFLASGATTADDFDAGVRLMNAAGRAALDSRPEAERVGKRRDVSVAA